MWSRQHNSLYIIFKSLFLLLITLGSRTITIIVWPWLHKRSSLFPNEQPTMQVEVVEVCMSTVSSVRIALCVHEVCIIGEDPIVCAWVLYHQWGSNRVFMSSVSLVRILLWAHELCIIGDNTNVCVHELWTHRWGSHCVCLSSVSLKKNPSCAYCDCHLWEIFNVHMAPPSSLPLSKKARHPMHKLRIRKCCFFLQVNSLHTTFNI